MGATETAEAVGRVRRAASKGRHRKAARQPHWQERAASRQIQTQRIASVVVVVATNDAAVVGADLKTPKLATIVLQLLFHRTRKRVRVFSENDRFRSLAPI